MVANPLDDTIQTFICLWGVTETKIDLSQGNDVQADIQTSHLPKSILKY
jgi:hypothetical protein